MKSTISVKKDKFLSGDIFLTRHFNESRNSSPGYWNHAAIFIDGSTPTIIEAINNEGVVKVPYKFWKNTVGIYSVFRYYLRGHYTNGASPVAQQAAKNAKKHLHKEYSFISSLFRFFGPIKRRRLNCVSLVRLCYKDALKGEDKLWTIPDDIENDKDFDLIYMSRNFLIPKILR